MKERVDRGVLKRSSKSLNDDLVKAAPNASPRHGRRQPGSRAAKRSADPQSRLELEPRRMAACLSDRYNVSRSAGFIPEITDSFDRLPRRQRSAKPESVPAVSWRSFD